MKKQCLKCGTTLDYFLPFQCKRCGNYFCEKHRLPENHECIGVKTSLKAWKEEQKKTHIVNTTISDNIVIFMLDS